MLDFDLSKMLIVGIIALIVIGPKELPAVLRTMGQVMGRMRKMASEFQAQFTAAMREAEVDDINTGLHQDITKVGADLTTQIGLGTTPATAMATSTVAPNTILNTSESTSEANSQHWKVPMPASLSTVEATPPMDLTAPLVKDNAPAGEATSTKPIVKKTRVKKPSETKPSETKLSEQKITAAKKTAVKKSSSPKSAALKLSVPTSAASNSKAKSSGKTESAS